MAPRDQLPRVVYRKMGDIELMSITSDELDQFERGSSSDTLAFAIGSLGACVAFVLALAGGTFVGAWLNLILCGTFVSGGLGLFWLVKGLREKKSNKVLAEAIRKRHPPEGKKVGELPESPRPESEKP